METRIYRTRINDDVSYGAFGRVARAMDLIRKDASEENKGYSLYSIVGYDDNDKFFQTCFTELAVYTDQERYDRFVALIKNWFPELDIEFDVKE